jgi:hypothetical protein
MENVQWFGHVTKIGGDKECIQNFTGKHLLETSLGRPRDMRR